MLMKYYSMSIASLSRLGTERENRLYLTPQVQGFRMTLYTLSHSPERNGQTIAVLIVKMRKLNNVPMIVL